MKNKTTYLLFSCAMIINFLVITPFIISCSSSNEKDIVDSGNTVKIYSTMLEAGFYGTCLADDPIIDCTGEINWSIGWADGTTIGNKFTGYRERSFYDEEIVVIFDEENELIRAEMETHEKEGLIGRVVERIAIFKDIPVTQRSVGEIVFSVSGEKTFDHIIGILMDIHWIEANLHAHLENWKCNENSYIKVTCKIAE